jgi:arginyl-tRNA synthetase
LRNAQELGASLELKDFDPAQLSHDRENELLGALAEFPRVVASAAEFRELTQNCALPRRISGDLSRLLQRLSRFADGG